MQQIITQELSRSLMFDCIDLKANDIRWLLATTTEDLWQRTCLPGVKADRVPLRYLVPDLNVVDEPHCGHTLDT